MLNAKVRMLWIQWHAYLSCFFLPLALLYTLTGAIYLLGIEGGVASSSEFELAGRPASEEPADLVEWLTPALKSQADRCVPEIYYRERGEHGWYNMRGGVHLTLPEDPEKPVEVHVDNYDLWLQLVLIHKGVAGPLFVVLGVLLGVSLLFSLISGALVAVSMPKFKRQAWVYMGLGLLSLLLAYALT